MHSSADWTEAPAPFTTAKGMRKSRDQRATTMGWWCSHQTGAARGITAMQSRIPAKGMHIQRAAVGSAISAAWPPAASTGTQSKSRAAKKTGIFFNDKTSLWPTHTFGHRSFHFHCVLMGVYES